ncbi:50S ribosomal protein L23 [bacterium]|nr:50S ribosomal protein L23 [bacterium]
MPEFHYADVLIHPVVSEKSNDLMITQNKYVFVVSPRATKTDIRRAVTERFNVKVTGVNLIKLPGKPKRFGRHTFHTAKRRKAIVTLAAGEGIPELSEAV